MGNKIEAKLFVESMKSAQRPRCVPGFALADSDAKLLDTLATGAGKFDVYSQ